MNGYSDVKSADALYSLKDFDIDGLDDEIRVDERCQRLLRLFYLDQVDSGRLPEEAGAMAHGADYFLRDFIIADRRENIFTLDPGRVRQFAGNWYITRKLEPNMAELESILRGVGAFYEYAQKIGRVSEELAAGIRAEAEKLELYRRRIEEFWAIEDDGFVDWNRQCPVED
jgi:hypothetical protein